MFDPVQDYYDSLLDEYRGAGSRIEGPEDLTKLLQNVSAARNVRDALGPLAAAQIAPSAAIHPALRGTIDRMSNIAEAMHAYAAKIESDNLVRPNQWSGIFTDKLAPLGTANFTVTPSAGQPAWTFLGLYGDDTQAQDFGVSALTFGGLPNVLSGAQTTPNSPVANAVPLAGIMIREASFAAAISPWQGRSFDNTSPMTGTIVNMTQFGDSITRSCRLLIAIQADPCGPNIAAAAQSVNVANQIFTRSINRVSRLGGGVARMALGGAINPLTGR